MTIKPHIIEGIFRPVPKTKDFELELNLPKSGLKIKGLSKKLLIEKKTELEKEHAIYILDGPLNCYVGKSTDIQSRINNHKDKNKSDFTRCFMGLCLALTFFFFFFIHFKLLKGNHYE